ncbi:HAMP domain-containing protein [Methylosinus sp. H3A]|uniref:methyl-accepting chemotaxis protein n=1 Tax=Methylosinus sp. H3A TaxID=2785786 RepID=UPI0018C280DC|nr:methyl-accepting chemotaxis protein [Methylosinus sp. H3A]MBG0808637.1 HAMP domain-containing protein [Methylosinus sp. H3A]
MVNSLRDIVPTGLRARSAMLLSVIAVIAFAQAIVSWRLFAAASGWEAARDPRLATLFVGPALIALLCILGAVAVRTRMVTPLAAVTEAIRRLADGDTSYRLEIDECSESVRRLAEAFVNLRQVILDHRADESLIVEANAAQARIVQLLGDGLAKIAEKDLTYRLTDEVPRSYRRLQTDFNTAVGQLSEAIGEMAESTKLLGSGMQETVAAADDLSRRTESQASNLEETAAALAQITETVARTAEDAENARQIVSNMSSEAESSGGIVRQAIGGMGDIEQSSKKISQIIGVIDSIATQTNLLALNAGVEAARAGEAGRGFAVVAAEIRDLARRSAKAAKEIDILISVSNAQIGRGVSLVGDTGEALSHIVEEIGRVNGVVAEIAERARQQAAALNEVNGSVRQMDMITQQNAAMAEQTTAVSHELSEKTKRLIDLISRFRIARDFEVATPYAAVPRLAASGGEVVASGRIGASERRSRVWTDF